MIKQGMTIKEAAQEWVNGFDAIQQGMIQKLMDAEPEDWQEVTTPAVGDRAYVYEESAEGEIVRLGESKFRIKMDGGKKLWAAADDFEVVRDSWLPMWGTMWSFHDPCDCHRIEEGSGIEVLSQNGFRVYKSEEFGYFFGIDGCGYDFYEAHWIPLYKAWGLEWHDPKTEVATA